MLASQLSNPCQQIDLTDQPTRQMILQFQLKKLLLYGPSLGVYALPSLDDEEVWNGIIFVRHGYYKEGKFKFNIHLQSFPQQLPKINFITKLYHPLVNFSTGQWDIDAALGQNWNYGNGGMLYTVITALSNIFNSNELLSMKQSLNPQAGRQFENNLSQFMFEAMKSVDQSVEGFQMEEVGTSLALGEIPAADNQHLRRQLEAVCVSDGSIDDKIQTFMAFLLQ